MYLGRREEFPGLTSDSMFVFIDHKERMFLTHIALHLYRITVIPADGFCGKPYHPPDNLMKMKYKSKNGSKELVSLLQYMKNTTLDNPEILIKDKRIVELDSIVAGVRESEEWEESSMPQSMIQQRY